MERVQNSGEINRDPPLPSESSRKTKQDKPNVDPWNGKWETPGHKYTKEANIPEHHRNRRATRPPKEEIKKNTCSLFIQTDPFIWRHISDNVSHYAFYYIFFFFSKIELDKCQH